MRSASFVISFAAFLGISTASEAQMVSLATENQRLDETVLERARISGSLVAGLQRSGAEDGPVRIIAELPADWAGDLICVRVVTIDGLYVASNPYQIAESWTGGAVELPYPTAHRDFLARRENGAVGVRVHRSSCDATDGELAVAAWRGATGAPALMLNAFGAEVVFAAFGDAAPVRCETLPLSGKLAYDVRCVPSVLEDEGASRRVRILRVVNGKAAPEHVVTLRGPS